jgi:excisionase family DNA binding protein
MTAESKLERATLTIEEAAVVLGIGRSAAYAAAQSGELPTVRIGRRLLVPKPALDQMLSSGAAPREIQGVGP